MNKIDAFAIVFCLILTVLGYPQDQEVLHPDVPAQRSFPPPKVTPDMEPSKPIPPADDSEFTISKHVHEVNLILSVTDSKGRFVDNLTVDDFRLLDNHKSPERWTYFQARTNLPLHVILAVDISSSIRERLRFEQRAASHFLKNILRQETDAAAIVAFGSTVQEKTVGMVSDVNALDAAIHALQAGGETAMYDAITLSSHKLSEHRGKTVGRPVIILLTDGADTCSKSTLKTAEEAAIRSEAAIFALDANSIYETNPKGRLVLEKGIFDLLDAYARLDAGLRSDVGLVFAGDGISREELAGRAKRISPGTICFPGFAQREDLAGLYALADFLVLPTHSDPWGLVVNEAMACGVPIIVSGVAGCSTDLVEEGWNGYIVPPRDSEKLSVAFDSLLRNSELRQAMSAHNLERIRNYSPEACADGLAAAAMSVSTGAR